MKQNGDHQRTTMPGEGLSVALELIIIIKGFEIHVFSLALIE